MATLKTINKVCLLAEALNSARNDRDVLITQINNPICGKPHQGFKAMRKLRPLLAIADANVVAIEQEINVFLNPPKSNQTRRAARCELWDQAQRTCVTQTGQRICQPRSNGRIESA